MNISVCFFPTPILYVRQWDLFFFLARFGVGHSALSLFFKSCKNVTQIFLCERVLRVLKPQKNRANHKHNHVNGMKMRMWWRNKYKKRDETFNKMSRIFFPGSVNLTRWFHWPQNTEYSNYTKSNSKRKAVKYVSFFSFSPSSEVLFLSALEGEQRKRINHIFLFNVAIIMCICRYFYWLYF